MEKPIPRKEVYDLYWYLASERQKIFEKRISNQNPPWTKDPILGKYKFCNAFRAADRVSQYMIKNVACNPHKINPEDRIFQIILFRIFSNIQTWESLKEDFGHYPLISDLKLGSLAKSLDSLKDQNKKIYTGAFILCANKAYGFSEKHKNHLALMKEMFLQKDISTEILGAKSLKEIYKILHGFPLIGDFMAYQIAIDLNYSSLINFDENSFVKPGPGCLRGIKKVFISLGDHTPEEIILHMVKNQEKEFKRLGLPFKGLFGRPLHAIDCQGLFCELDKYCRQKLPDLKSSRKRIKTIFKENRAPIEFIFPGKWNLKPPRTGNPQA